MTPRKSATCKGKKTAGPLTEYDSEREALEGADHANRKYGRDLVPYQCDRCGLWHLSPKERQTPSSKCAYCTGTDGKPKDSYRSREEAQRRADILYREQGVALDVYGCEHGNGWHLTRGLNLPANGKKRNGKKRRR